MQKCKYLARVIKSRRAPPWPSPPTTDLPPKDIADKLVDCYIRTIESVYRILHLPSFRRDYEAIWASNTEPDIQFLVQLKLVLAIGGTTYDDEFSMRASAVHWVYEARSWSSEPEFKPRLRIETLQTNILLLIAQETAGVGKGSTWISVGALLRTAIYMGLHRDPELLPKRTIFAAEMRRRLWNTILEIALQSSLDSGGPPLVSIDDFDAEPPSNFDDNQLVANDPVVKAEDVFTEVSIAIALRKTFPIRLKIIKFLNGLGTCDTYSEALRLDAELRELYKALCRTILGYKSGAGRLPSQFDTQVVDFIMHRYFSSLHIPFFGLSHETVYAFSRKVVIETSLKIWHAVFPPPTRRSTHAGSDTFAPCQGSSEDLVRLAVCGSGFFCTVAYQASLLIAAELKAQLQEEQGLSPVPLRPDLVYVLDDAKSWALQCLKAGETNTKGYIMLCMVTAQIEALKKGLEGNEIAMLIVKALEKAEQTCLPILEGKAAQAQTGPFSSNPSPKTIYDVDFMVCPNFRPPNHLKLITYHTDDRCPV